MRRRFPPSEVTRRRRFSRRVVEGPGRPLGPGWPLGPRARGKAASERAAPTGGRPPRGASMDGRATAGRAPPLPKRPRSLRGLAAIYSRRLQSGRAREGAAPSVALDGSTRLRNAGKWRPPRAGQGRAERSGGPPPPPRKRRLLLHAQGFRNEL